MTISLSDSAIYGGLFSDPEMVRLFDDAAQLRAMAAVEGALARCQGRMGAIPMEAAERISEVCEVFADGHAAPDPDRIASGTSADGIPVPAFVRALREAVGEPAAAYIHFGATTQDIMDTALILRVREAFEILERRLAGLSTGLESLIATHRDTPMVGRTRSMQATPTTFGLKCANWRAPLLRQQRRLDALRPHALLLAFGGAAGTMAAYGEDALSLEAAMARELNLGLAALPWHAARDPILEIGGWLGQLAAILGKIGVDLMHLSSSEVGEISLSGGGSSTMPNKVNPVGPEVLVAIARASATRLADLHQAALAEHERGGAAWMLEWQSLPQLVVLAGAATRQAQETLASMRVEPERMRDNLDRSLQLVLAEAATFALAEHMPRPEAASLVKATCVQVRETGTPLLLLLQKATDAPVDWVALADPLMAAGQAGPLVDRALRRHL
ncbi:MAG: 3-carboxy-cis,cis-muconate cycloisomerase [Pseudomonadota bacterium]